MPKRKIKKGIIIAIAVVVLLLAILIPVGLRFMKSNVSEVRTGISTTGDIVSSIILTADIQSQNEQNVYALQQLKVKSVPVKAGSIVSKGDLLISFDTSDYKKTMDDAKDSENELKDKLDKTEAELAALKALNDPTKATEIVTKQTTIAQLETAYEQSQTAYNTAKSRYDALVGEIKADFNGIVTSVNINEGAVSATSPTQPAIKVLDNKNLKATIKANRYDSKKIEVGQDVTIIFDEKRYKAAVSNKVPVATQTTTANGVEAMQEISVTFKDNTDGLIIGFTADAEIKIGEVKDVVKVPAEAVRKIKEQYFVYTLNNDGIVKKIEVTIGLQSDSETEITGGLNINEKVILNPDNTLTDGQKVSEKVGA